MPQRLYSGSGNNYADVDGQFFGVPWILTEFINDKLICEYQLTEENKKTLGAEYEDVYRKISSITSDLYGDTFTGGFVGQHTKWAEVVSQIARLSYEDGVELWAFGGNAQIVELAVEKALCQIEGKYSWPVLFHCDFFSANIMGACKDKTIQITNVIDFGMSMFAPKYYSHYITWKYTDFAVTPLDISSAYGISSSELAAYDILRIEPVLLANIFKFDGYEAFAAEFIQKCEWYVMAEV